MFELDCANNKVMGKFGEQMVSGVCGVVRVFELDCANNKVMGKFGEQIVLFVELLGCLSLIVLIIRLWEIRRANR